MLNFTDPQEYSYPENTNQVSIPVPPELGEGDAMFVGVSLGYSLDVTAGSLEGAGDFPMEVVRPESYASFYMVSFLNVTPPEELVIRLIDSNLCTFSIVAIGILTTEPNDKYVQMLLDSSSEPDWYDTIPGFGGTTVPFSVEDGGEPFMAEPKNGATYLHWVGYTELLGSPFNPNEPVPPVPPDNSEIVAEAYSQRIYEQAEIYRLQHMGSILAIEEYFGADNQPDLARQWTGPHHDYWHTCIVRYTEEDHPLAGTPAPIRVASGVNTAYFATSWHKNNPAEIVRYNWRGGSYEQINDDFDVGVPLDITQSFIEDAVFVLSKRVDDLGLYLSYIVPSGTKKIIKEFTSDFTLIGIDSSNTGSYFNYGYIDAQSHEDGVDVWLCMNVSHYEEGAFASVSTEIWRFSSFSGWINHSDQLYKRIEDSSFRDIAVSVSGNIYLLNYGSQVFKLPIVEPLDGASIEASAFADSYRHGNFAGFTNHRMNSISVDRFDNVFGTIEQYAGGE